MREYIIAYRGNWIHFFIKPHIGLCSRKRNGFKFEEYEIVSLGATADFCVYSSGELIHVVCQDEKGSVLYLLYDGKVWKKTILLESRTAKPYNKNFTMVNLSGYINLLYLVENKEKVMLVHQILDSSSSPEVVAYIKNDAVPFCVCPHHHETSFSVYYTDENGMSCKQLYKWSQKKFLKTSPFEENLSIKFSEEFKEGHALAATQKTGNITTLIYVDKNNEKSPVYLDCRSDIIPVISEYGGKHYMVWTEHGSIMSSCLKSDGKWSKPMQYAKSSSTETKLYAVCTKGRYEYYYGTKRENDITLYGTHDILKKPPSFSGSEDNAFAHFASHETEKLLISQEKQIKLLCHELSVQRQRLADLSEKIESLLNTVPIADEEAIDNILLN